MPNVTAYLGIGSNVGNRHSNIRRSIHFCSLNARLVIEKISSLYETSPCGGPKNQAHFLNGAIEITTSLSPFDLLYFLKTIEKKLKRQNSLRWSPRTIDLDILLFGDLILMNTMLSIPHPLLTQRMFVLKPLSDIAFDVKHPLCGKSVGQLLKNLYKKNEETITAFN